MLSASKSRIQAETDAGFGSPTTIWEEIDRSESYLVSSMFEEALSTASDVVKQLISRSHVVEDVDDYMDMLESASMVLVQSLPPLHKSSQILNDLERLFASVELIPVRVLVAGACLQLSSNSPSGVGDVLLDFLSKWRLVAGDPRAHYALVNDLEGCFVLGVDEYVEVVELYVTRLLATTLDDVDRAISWVEKAQLPDDTREGLFRRLHSLHSVKDTKSLSVDNHKERITSDGSQKDDALNEAKRKTVLRLSKRVEPCFWLFRSINLKFGNTRVVVSNGKVAIGCMLLFLYWILRRKQISIKRIVERQALNVKKAVVELWQLAFSYQVNPLAAVQPPSVPTRR